MDFIFMEKIMFSCLVKKKMTCVVPDNFKLI